MKCMKCQKDVPMIEISDHIKKMHLGAKIDDDDDELYLDPMEDNKEVLDLEPDTGKKEEKPKKKCNRSGCQFEAHEQEELDTHVLTCLYRSVKCYKCKSFACLANINDGNHMNCNNRCFPDKSFKCCGSTGQVLPRSNENYFGAINHDDKVFHVFVDNTKGKEVYVRFSGTHQESLGYVAKIRCVTEELVHVLPYELSIEEFERTNQKSGFEHICTKEWMDSSIGITIQKLN
jgi:hypothetical protein